jgi:hypothetical protein
MSLLHIPFEDVTENHLKSLIAANARESRDIEYKRGLYGNSDADHAEWLSDISSFANAAGGDLILGMEAVDGVPLRLAPITANFDQEILRLEEKARSNLQPRIQGLQLKPILLAGPSGVLFIRVQRSYNPPHRVVTQRKGGNRFWARSSAGKYEPNVEELRALFTLAPQLTQRIRDFRFDRIAKIAAGETPVRLLDECCVIVHVVPFSAFDPGYSLPLGQIESSLWSFPPIGSNSYNIRINFDGALLLSNADRGALQQRAYTQVYRSGSIEAVASSVTGGGGPVGSPRCLQSIKVEGYVMVHLVKYLKSLRSLGVNPPFAVTVSIIGVKNVLANVGLPVVWHDDNERMPLDREQYHFSEVIITSVPNSTQECAIMMRPFIEQLANMVGRVNSSSFGPDGSYLPMFR